MKLFKNSAEPKIRISLAQRGNKSQLKLSVHHNSKSVFCISKRDFLASKFSLFINALFTYENLKTPKECFLILNSQFSNSEKLANITDLEIELR